MILTSPSLPLLFLVVVLSSFAHADTWPAVGYDIDTNPIYNTYIPFETDAYPLRAACADELEGLGTRRATAFLPHRTWELQKKSQICNSNGQKSQ